VSCPDGVQRSTEEFRIAEVGGVWNFKFDPPSVRNSVYGEAEMFTTTATSYVI